MYRDTLEKPLAELGLTPQNFHALRLLPLLYVAWANGRISHIERDQVLRAAREQLELGAEAMQLVDRWLRQPPSDRVIREGIACLRRAAAAPDQPDFGSDDLLHILWDAERLTRRAAILTGRPYEPSPEQHDALLELADLMQLDEGVPWLDLLEELGGTSEVWHTLPKTARGPKPNASERSRGDRVRRWRTAFRLDRSHSGNIAPEGGLI